MSQFEMGTDGYLHQKGRSCMLCARLKDNKRNDGYDCKFFNECDEKRNYPKFVQMYTAIAKKEVK